MSAPCLCPHLVLVQVLERAADLQQHYGGAQQVDRHRPRPPLLPREHTEELVPDGNVQRLNTHKTSGNAQQGSQHTRLAPSSILVTGGVRVMKVWYSNAGLAQPGRQFALILHAYIVTPCEATLWQALATS